MNEIEEIAKEEFEITWGDCWLAFKIWFPMMIIIELTWRFI